MSDDAGKPGTGRAQTSANVPEFDSTQLTPPSSTITPILRPRKDSIDEDGIFALDEDGGVSTADESSQRNEGEEIDNFEDEPLEIGNLRERTTERRAYFAEMPAREKPPIAASLPVAIDRSSFWMPQNDVEEEEDDEVGDYAHRPRTLAPREDTMFRNMQAYSRSIQPDDDPERLFGPRPDRRRNRTDEPSGITVPGGIPNPSIPGGGPRIVIPSSLSRYS